MFIFDWDWSNSNSFTTKPIWSTFPGIIQMCTPVAQMNRDGMGVVH